MIMTDSTHNTISASKEHWPTDVPDTLVHQDTGSRYHHIAKALASAQLEMQNPGFDSVNPHFKNKFASLAAVRNAVVPILAKHGIAMMQNLMSVDGAVSCQTLLIHESGQMLSFGPLVLPVSKNDAQGFGSAATYARRYSLMAVAGVVGDVDDDANAASSKDGIHHPKGDLGKNVPAEKSRSIADDMLRLLQDDMTEDQRVARIADLHANLTTEHDLYIASSDHLSAADRRAWKEYVKQARTKEVESRVIR